MIGDSTTLIVTSSFTYYENFLTIVFGHPKLRVNRKWFNFETCMVFTWRRGCCCWLLVVGYCWLLLFFVVVVIVVVLGYDVDFGCGGCCCFWLWWLLLFLVMVVVFGCGCFWWLLLLSMVLLQ